jgi:hypothetical protein
MRLRFFSRNFVGASFVVGLAYACSGNPEVVVRGEIDNTGGSSASGGKNSGGGGGTLSGGSNSGGSIGVTGGSGGRGGTSSGGKSGNAGGKGGASTGGTGGDMGSGAFGGFPDIDFEYDAGMMGQGGACDQVSGKGTLVKRPMDIIVSIDNSGSMSGEIEAVVENINVDFASIIEASGIDYRVIMVSRYGELNYDLNPSNFSVCIGPPLGNAACPDPNTTAPALVNTARFFHHSTDIGSNNMWCRLLTSYTTPDEYPTQRSGWTDLAPNGWQDWVRGGSFKVFIGITDDIPQTDSSGDSGSGQNCRNTAGGINDPGGLNNTLAGAQTFDRALRTLDPAQFGPYDMNDPDAGRNYRWYSIVGMAEKANDPTDPYDPSEPVVTQVCTGPGGGNNNGVAAGQGYQELSIMTGGLRYSNCLNDDFDAIFNAIAEGVIEGARASCEYDVPVPDDGIVDFDQTTVAYHPNGNAMAAVNLSRAATDQDCGTDPGFYFNGDNTKIFLCPATCTTVQEDPGAEVSINFGCLGS